MTCSYVGRPTGDQCPKCGGRMRTAKYVRRHGWVQAVYGVLFLGMMGAITYFVAPDLSAQLARSAGGSRGSVAATQTQLVLGLFGLAGAFGLMISLNGLWQIVTGRRNKWIKIVLLGMIGLLVLLYWTLKGALGG